MIVPDFAKDAVPLAEQRGWLIEGLIQCAERAMSIGVTLVMENFNDPPGRSYMSRGSECREICAQVDSLAYRLIYDCGAPQLIGANSVDTLVQMARPSSCMSTSITAGGAILRVRQRPAVRRHCA